MKNKLCPSPATAVEASRMAEVSFESATAYAAPFNEVTTNLTYVAGSGIMARAHGRIVHRREAAFNGGQVGRDSVYRELINQNMNSK